MMFLLQLLLLVPMNFGKMVFNIIKVGSTLSAIYLLLLWALVGPFFLFYALIKDLQFFMRSLCIIEPLHTSEKGELITGARREEIDLQ